MKKSSKVRRRSLAIRTLINTYSDMNISPPYRGEIFIDTTRNKFLVYVKPVGDNERHLIYNTPLKVGEIFPEQITLLILQLQAIGFKVLFIDNDKCYKYNHEGNHQNADEINRKKVEEDELRMKEKEIEKNG